MTSLAADWGDHKMELNREDYALRHTIAEQ